MNGYGRIGDPNYNRGLGNVNDLNNYDSPRYTNVYGQSKWEKVCSINKKLKRWIPYLKKFSFLETKSFIYRTEKQKLNVETYIKAIKTFAPVGISESSNDITKLVPEKINNSFIQASIFKIPEEQNINYFMIVNRRCSPFINNLSYNSVGGRRMISINFDSNKLQDFNKWKLIDVYDNSIVAEFSKSSIKEITLGAFNPGEGKLYKLLPY